MSDATAFVIAALVTLWLGAPLWVWLPFAIACAVCVLADLGSGN